jgi:hypothetical protein
MAVHKIDFLESKFVQQLFVKDSYNELHENLMV